MDEPLSARSANLRYVSDCMAGITRRRRGRQFTYWRGNGTQVRDRRELARIRALAIPPAWTDVWICPLPHGHLQATGRDARGRKQYRYHPRWRTVRDAAKFDHVLAFGAALPRIRRHTAAVLRHPAVTREWVLATVVRLLEKTLIRVGNEEYVRANGSFGLTTMRDRHVTVRGASVRFAFRAKSGIRQEIVLDDRALARAVKRCQDLPGQTLFQYIGDDGQTHGVDSADVNDYLRTLTGADFTAKDFRTWTASVMMAQALCTVAAAGSESAHKRNVNCAIASVAAALGNTKAVCRKSYIHPAVIDAYLAGTTIDSLPARSRVRRIAHLSAAETRVLALLKQRLAPSRARPAPGSLMRGGGDVPAAGCRRASRSG